MTVNGLQGARSAKVTGLETLQCPQEKGTKAKFETFMELLENHIGLSWPSGADIKHVMKHGKDPHIPQPQDLSDADKKSDWKVIGWTDGVKEYFQRVAVLTENKRNLFSLMYMNLSQITQSKIKCTKGYETANNDMDPMWLKEKLEDIMIEMENDAKPKEMLIDDQMQRVLNMKQGDTESNDIFVKLMMREIKAIEKHSGIFLWGKHQDDTFASDVNKAKLAHRICYKKDMDSAEEKEAKRICKLVLKEKIWAMAILKRSNTGRFQHLLTKLHNDYLMGHNGYPDTVAEVLKLLNHYKPEPEVRQSLPPSSRQPGNRNSSGRSRSPPPQSGNRNGGRRGPSVAFVQASEPPPVLFLQGTNRSWHPHVTCHTCGHKGHYNSDCPLAANERFHRRNQTNATVEE